MNNNKRFLSLTFVLILAVFVTVFTCACGGEKADDNANDSIVPSVTEVGQGAKSFSLEVINGAEKNAYLVKTDKTTVGDALLELGIISGKADESGLFVETVNGVTANYIADGTYWAFYEGDNYAAKGITETEIAEAVSYSLRFESTK